MQFNHEEPRGESDEVIGMLEGKALSELTIVRNNHVGTTFEVYDHSGTTRVDCEASAKEPNELLEGMEGMEEDYPWYSASSIKKWNIVELGRPRQSWTIDNYDGAESFEELGIEPVPRENAGEDMPPEKCQALRRQLQSVEMELDMLMNRGEVTEISRQRQWEHWSRIATTDNKSEEGPEVGKAGSCSPLETAQTNLDGVQKAWRHDNQPYHATQWSTTSKTINCFLGGAKPGTSKHKLAILEDEDSDAEEEHLICSTTGRKWESLPFPVIIDSGACASVMPSGWCRHVSTQKTRQSEAGEYFRAANGNKLYNEGQKFVSMMTREGTWRDMRFTACDVSKALGSVSQMCRAGHTAVFNPPWHEAGSYIEHLDTGEKMWLEEANGLYVFNAKVAPKELQITLNPGFPGQASP